MIHNIAEDRIDKIIVITRIKICVLLYSYLLLLLCYLPHRYCSCASIFTLLLLLCHTYTLQLIAGEFPQQGEYRASKSPLRKCLHQNRFVTQHLWLVYYNRWLTCAALLAYLISLSIRSIS